MSSAHATGCHCRWWRPFRVPPPYHQDRLEIIDKAELTFNPTRILLSIILPQSTFRSHRLPIFPLGVRLCFFSPSFFPLIDSHRASPFIPRPHHQTSTTPLLHLFSYSVAHPLSHLAIVPVNDARTPTMASTAEVKARQGQVPVSNRGHKLSREEDLIRDANFIFQHEDNDDSDEKERVKEAGKEEVDDEGEEQEQEQEEGEEVEKTPKGQNTGLRALDPPHKSDSLSYQRFQHNPPSTLLAARRHSSLRISPRREHLSIYSLCDAPKSAFAESQLHVSAFSASPCLLNC